MFCDRCGTAVQSDQRFCSNCGKELVGAQIPGYPQPNRVQSHIHLLGILWLAASALNAVGGLVLFVLANTLFVHLPEMGNVPPGAVGWLRPLLTFFGILILTKGAAGFLAGWGLLQRQSWARILTLILAFFALFNIPFGTALGIYTLWVLLPSGADAEYEQEVRRAASAGRSQS